MLYSLLQLLISLHNLISFFPSVNACPLWSFTIWRVKYDVLELSRQFHVILHGYQNGDEDETVFAACLRFPKKNINKNRKRCSVLFKVFIFSNLPSFFGTNFRNRTTFPSTRVRALFLHISLNHQTCVTFSVTFACNIRLCVCDIGIISVHLGVYVFVCVKLVDLTCVLYSV